MELTTAYPDAESPPSYPKNQIAGQPGVRETAWISNQIENNSGNGQTKPCSKTNENDPQKQVQGFLIGHFWLLYFKLIGFYLRPSAKSAAKASKP
jgi:hypothetical protein